MKLHINWTACDGRGLCIELLPELLAEDDWGYPLSREGTGGDVTVPPALEKYAQRAISQCPRLALSVHR